jgi:hypothetical protein
LRGSTTVDSDKTVLLARRDTGTLKENDQHMELVEDFIQDRASLIVARIGIQVVHARQHTEPSLIVIGFWIVFMSCSGRVLAHLFARTGKAD